MNKPVLYKMSGAGNDFVVLDGRGVDAVEFRQKKRITDLCAAYRTDGLMILGKAPKAGPGESRFDFRMEFFNPDGSGGMMCGNGGRCIVAFADWIGVEPASADHYEFMAPDGPHRADILSRPESGLSGQWTVRLQMKDVDGIESILGGYFLNTGTRHFVKFVEDADAVNVEEEGKALRWNPAFAPEGANVNFVQVCEDSLKIRTFEKGVEGETLACGTGITAAAIAAFAANSTPGGEDTGRVRFRLQARRGDILTVEFTPSPDRTFKDIWLTGPAEFCRIQ